jgi:hypothetical protein
VILITARAAGPGQAANRKFIGDAEQTISVFVLAALAFWNAPAAFRSPFSSTVQKTEHTYRFPTGLIIPAVRTLERFS